MSLRLFFPLVVLMILVIIIITTLRYPRDACLFPLLIGIPLVALIIVQIAQEISDIRGVQDEQVMRATKLLAVLGWIVAFLLSIYLLGYFVGIPLFLFLYLKLHSVRWPTTIFCTLGITAAIYFGFEVALKMTLYKGVLFG